MRPYAFDAVRPQISSLIRSAPFLLVLTALFWGGHWVVARAIITEATPFSLSFWRWACATAILAPFAWPHVVRDAAKLRAQWKPIALLSLTGTGLYNGIGYVGVQDTTATNALLIQSVTPALIPVLGFFLVHERIGPAAIAGVAMSCAGVLSIASKLDLQAVLALQFNRGDLWLLANVCMWATYTVCLRWKPVGLHPFSFLFALMAVGVLQLAPFFAYEMATGGGVKAGAQSVLAILYLGLFPAVLNYLMWNRAVGEIGAARAGPYLYLVPVFGTAMAFAFLGERLHLYHFVGVVLIFGGIWLASRDKRRAV
jgi:drug/metabolite transporter (DMT)-like permease